MTTLEPRLAQLRCAALASTAVATCVLALSLERAHAQTVTKSYSSLWSVGDSLSDVGRTYAYTKSLPFVTTQPVGSLYDNGRFSNGPVWLEYLKGIQTPQYDANRNLAWGGSVTGSYESFKYRVAGPDELEKQIDGTLIPSIVGEKPGLIFGTNSYTKGYFGSTPLVTLWIGGNNFRQVIEDQKPKAAELRQALDTQASAIVKNVPADLASINSAFGKAYPAGTSPTYYVLTVPDVSETPKFASLPTSERQPLHNVVTLTNRSLKDSLYSLADTFASTGIGSRLVVVDAAALLNEVQQNPGDFGFREARKNCVDAETGNYANGCSAANVSQFLFWDQFHPTTKAHEMIAKYATNTDALEGGTVAQLDQPYVANIEIRDRTYAGAITGVGSMLKLGERALTLSGWNTYQGGTRIDQGALRVSADANLGATSGALTFRGGVLNTAQSFSMARDVVIKDSVSRGLLGGSDFGATFDTDTGTVLTLSGGKVSGTGDLAKTGYGTLDLQSQVQDARARTQIQQGALLIDTSSPFRSSQVDVLREGTLGGTGTIVGNVRNTGTTRPGSLAGLGVLTVSGSFVQPSTGTLAITADFENGRSSQLKADVASVKGAIAITPLTLTPTELPIIATTRTLDLAPDSVTKTLAVDYGVRTVGDGGRNANLYVAKADFTPAGVALNEDQQRAGDMLNALWGQNKVGDVDGALARLASVMDPTTYAGLLEGFDAEGFGAAPVKQADSSAKFKTNLMSCPVFAGDGSLTVETECAWGRLYGSRTDRFADADDEGYRETGAIMQVGVQKQVGANTFLGLSLGYEDSLDRSRDGGASSSGQGVSGGVALKRQLGPWLLAAALEGGAGWYANTRSTGPLDGDVAHSNSRLDHVSGRLRAAYTFDFGPWYAKPYTDLDLSYLHTPGFAEKDGGPLGLRVMGSNVFLATLIPTLEVGGRINVGQNWTARPYGSAGVSLVSDSNYAVRSVLTGAPLSDAYESLIRIPNVLANVKLGADVQEIHGFEVKLEIGGDFAHRYRSESGTVRVGYRF